MLKILADVIETAAIKKTGDILLCMEKISELVLKIKGELI
jgi:hypothetical protein